MDGLSFHPYPDAATDALDRGYPVAERGFVNLDRIKQALWDAFTSTPQPTTVDGLSSISTRSAGRSTRTAAPAIRAPRTSR